MKKSLQKMIVGAAVAASLLAGIAPAASAGTRATLKYEPNDANVRTTLVLAGGGGTAEAKPAGDCVGVSACNQFIADCIAAGGEFVEEHHNPQGQPNLGHCD